MRGMSRTDGQSLAGLDHLRQSILDILTTPKGSRVMRRGYGSDLFQLIDRPVNHELRIDIYAAIADALDRWEPRLRVTRIRLESEDSALPQGRVGIGIYGHYLPDGETIAMENLRIL